MPVSDPAAIDLSLNRGVQASAEMVGFEAAKAIDGNTSTFWSSGQTAPQWVMIDMGAPHVIQAIHLVVAQTPAGQTTHNIYGSATGAAGSWQLLTTLQGPTSDWQILHFVPEQAIANTRFIKVETPASPSSVAWRDIQVVGL